MVKTYHIVTYGCDANRADSERISALLESVGLKTVKKEDADVLIFNTCSVRQKAEDRIFGRNKEMATLKQKNPAVKIVLTGCMTHYSQTKLKKQLPFIDVFLPIKDIQELPKKLGLENNFKSGAKDYLSLSQKHQSEIRAYVPISTGCDNFCSYCIVPHSRGFERSRPSKEIINEVCKLVNGGFKEIWLLGQNVNAYGKKNKEISFAKLLLRINDMPGKFWIRFSSPHPANFTDELIEAMRHAEKFPKYVNLPVQSGDDEILKRMNRNYTIGEYKNLVSKLRKAMSDIAISTDVIVGFPSETQKQFQNTIKLFKEIKFDAAFISEYSVRPKTTAAIAFRDNVAFKEKEKRKIDLTKVLAKTALENNKKLVGKTIEVLIDRKAKRRVFGKTEGNRNIEIIGKEAQSLKEADFVWVEVKEANVWNLKGILAKNQK